MLKLALRAAVFDGRVFGEIGEEPKDMFRSLGVVAVAAIAFGLGIRSNIDVAADTGELVQVNLTMLIAMLTIVTSWAVWTVMVWLLGTKLFGGKASYRGLLRTLGICFGPMFFWLFLNIPVAGGWIALWAHIWVLAVGVLAVRQAQDFAWWKAGISASVGWLWALVIVPWVLVGPFLVPPP
jgi:hypothetical protein